MLLSCTGWHFWLIKISCWLRFGMFCHPFRVADSYSSGPPAAGSPISVIHFCNSVPVAFSVFYNSVAKSAPQSNWPPAELSESSQREVFTIYNCHPVGRAWANMMYPAFDQNSGPEISGHLQCVQKFLWIVMWYFSQPKVDGSWNPLTSR